jgi:hypothetical protein
VFYPSWQIRVMEVTGLSVAGYEDSIQEEAVEESRHHR